MDSREYLNYVLDKLQERIRKLDDAILHGQKEIENMHEYYWENYTEMDQYGYEDFDNQQALLGQVNANKEKLDLRRRFKKMLDSPFFGRVDFIYDGEEEAETFYIGIGNFSKESEDSRWSMTGVPRFPACFMTTTKEKLTMMPGRTHGGRSTFQMAVQDPWREDDLCI